MNTRSLAVAVAAFIAVGGCKKRPAPVLDSCNVTNVVMDEGNTISATIMFGATGGKAGKPEGKLLVEVKQIAAPSAKSPNTTFKCTMQATVDEGTFQADGAADVKLEYPDYCAGDPPPGHYVQVESYFTPTGKGDAMTCVTDGPVLSVFGGHGKTVDEQQAEIERLAALEPKEPTTTTTTDASAAADRRPIVNVEIKDALRFPDGTVHEGSAPIEVYARVPDDWIVHGALTPRAKTAVLAKMYGGPAWEKGNSDGSRYLVRSFTSRVLTASEIARRVWAEQQGHVWFYDTPGGKLETATSGFAR